MRFDVYGSESICPHCRNNLKTSDGNILRKRNILTCPFCGKTIINTGFYFIKVKTLFYFVFGVCALPFLILLFEYFHAE